MRSVQCDACGKRLVSVYALVGVEADEGAKKATAPPEPKADEPVQA